MTTALIGQLHAIRDEHGVLTPSLVVDAARAPEHPLHSRFEWDDALAGEKYRLEQARQLLRVTFRPDPLKPVDLRAFVVQKGADSATSEYVPTGEVLANPFTRELLLRQMRRDWVTFKRRYEHMAEFAALVTEQAEGRSA